LGPFNLERRATECPPYLLKKLPLVEEPAQNGLCPLAVPSLLPSDGRGEGQGEVRVHWG